MPMSCYKLEYTLTDSPTLIGSYIISKSTLVKILNIEQFINLYV